MVSKKPGDVQERRLPSPQQWICELLLKNQQPTMGAYGMKELDSRENERRNV
jgi:hypothetical protein